MMIDSTEWMTGAEAARALGIVHQRLDQWANNARLEVIMPWPRVVLVSVADVDRLSEDPEHYEATTMALVRRNLRAMYDGIDPTALDPELIAAEALRMIEQARPGWSVAGREHWAARTTQRIIDGRSR